MRDEAAARLDDDVVQAVPRDERLLQNGERFELRHPREQPVVVAASDRVLAVEHAVVAAARIVARLAEQHVRIAGSRAVDELRVEVEEPRRRPARGEQGEEERVRQAAEHCASERIERPSAEAQRRVLGCSAARASERAGVNCGV